LGSLCVTTCAAPGIILDDLTTCYWDPEKCKTFNILSWIFITRLNHYTRHNKCLIIILSLIHFIF